MCSYHKNTLAYSSGEFKRGRGIIFDTARFVSGIRLLLTIADNTGIWYNQGINRDAVISRVPFENLIDIGIQGDKEEGRIRIYSLD